MSDVAAAITTPSDCNGTKPTPAVDRNKAFDFGANWAAFSDHALTPARWSEARVGFSRLLEGTRLNGCSFLDIGFGQGLGLLAARELGAEIVGCDYNPRCAEVLRGNQRRFASAPEQEIPVVVGSILDPAVSERLRGLAPRDEGAYDVVHSWGVLHHTGAMWEALDRAAALVRPSGRLVLAIYNQHWSSPAWLAIKWFYNRLPSLGQRMLTRLFLPIIAFAKRLATGADPYHQARGMDFYYDVVDWVGGYPYEWATPSQIESYLRARGFQLLKQSAPAVPTGCNEFVFQGPPAPAVPTR